MTFTGHNISLGDGETLPGTPLVEGNGVCQAALRMLSICCKPGARVADPGCLEGGYTVAFARAGYQAVGIEAKAVSYDRCVLVARKLALDNLTFVHDDVRHIAKYGPFDAVFCAGLLYHLDEPDAFLKTLGKLATRLLLIQSHFSGHPETTHEGRSGHWYSDDPTALLGSHRNQRSFWMAKEHLLQAIRDAGFPTVLTVHDYLDDIAAGPQGEPGPANPCGGITRGMFAGIKP